VSFSQARPSIIAIPAAATEMTQQAIHPEPTNLNPPEPTGTTGTTGLRSAAATRGQVKPGEVVFREHNRDCHSGQSDQTLAAYLTLGSEGEVQVGYLDFSDFHGEISVQFISVDEPHTHRGIGTGLLVELQRQHPGIEIGLGYATDPGFGLVESIPFKEVPSPEAPFFEELVKVRAEQARLQGVADAFFENPEACTGEAREEFDRQMELFNAVNDRAWELEQATWGKRPVKQLICFESGGQS